MNKYKNDTKLICPNCHAITTYGAVLEDAENGGPGMCTCEYVVEDADTKEPVYLRILHDYVLYDKWLKEENERNVRVVRATKEAEAK